jgi:hypothetical protein
MTTADWASLTGLAGTACLVWPAIKATRLFRLAESAKQRVKSIPKEQTQLAEWAGQLRDEVESMREEWKPTDALQLFVGIALTGVSDLLPLLKSGGWL